ncbi:hypothetical protein [Agromyces sp. Leaf222]|uniref:hypothetical protein n=1 Tax=Agromyces sp. Leaf222 TaxID=1735688 RepID=UPI0006FB08F6|nr:hypothetical protein [Agromyces sp. Leaf222]KQM83106.1 hypothetical protein ASE68_07530 [Agromyces sp. Leaf222]
MSKYRVAAVVALAAVLAAPAAAANAVEADTTKPVLGDSVFAPVKGTATFTVQQVESNPQKAYVEIQQKDAAGKWQKKAGQWFFDTNTFAFTVDTAALAEGVATQVKVSSWDDEGNQAGKSYPVVIDRTKPLATLVTPSTGGPFASSSIDIRVDATDAVGLNRITGNVYEGTTLVKSTSTSAAGALAGSHEKSVTLPDGEYSIKYNASDLAGNVSATGAFGFEIDTTAPLVILKEGTETTNGIFSTAPSFKLVDPGVGQIDYVEVNGAKLERSNDKWSDLNADGYTPAQGVNTIVAVDTAGNRSEARVFTFDSVAPKATVKGGETAGNVYATAPSFKLEDAGTGKVDYVLVNGKKYDRTDSKWSDLNAGNYAVVAGENTVVVVDTAGNSSTFVFTIAAA